MSHESLQQLENIAFIKPDGSRAPMNLCVTIPEISLFQAQETEQQIVSFLSNIAQTLLDPRSELLEVESIFPSDLHGRLIEHATHNPPLFVRLDCASVPETSDGSLPPAVEFQFRIGGQGFHEAIDDELLGHTPLSDGYAETLTEFFRIHTGTSPRVAITIPHPKSEEVRFWAEKLENHGIETTVIGFSPDCPNEAINVIQDLPDGSVIFRRELTLKHLLETTEGSKIIDKCLGGEIVFEPPLPLFFDGKASSVIAPRGLGVDTQVINDTPSLNQVLDKKSGVVKLGSGYDLERSFGGRSVAFIKGMSTGQRRQLVEIIEGDLTRPGDPHFWIWQPDIGDHKISVEIASHKNPDRPENILGRVRTMFFFSLFNEPKIIGAGFNISDNSKIVRGGHAIGTIKIV